MRELVEGSASAKMLTQNLCNNHVSSVANNPGFMALNVLAFTKCSAFGESSGDRGVQTQNSSRT